MKVAFFLITALIALHGPAVYGQDVTETIGFGQVSDSPMEGEPGVIRIRLEPQPVMMNVSGQVVPLTLTQFMNYTFTTPRTVPESVQMFIDNITDPAEYEGNKIDFNNTAFSFTIPAGNTLFDIKTTDIIVADDVNEAEEQFLLVVEIDSNNITFDEEGGILVVTILDSNPMFLDFNVLSYTFNESVGAVSNIIEVRKRDPSLETEVDIPIQVLALSGTADADVDINADTYVQNYTILINEREIVLSSIEIVDDMFPETEEEFTLSLMKGEGTEDLNVFPSTSVVTMTILDDDVAQIGFTESVYSVMEGESGSFQVCITLTNGVSLDTSHAHGNFVIDIDSTFASATVNEDYDMTPNPSTLTIRRGQEMTCSNITIYDNRIVERIEIFHMMVIVKNSTFSAGVNVTQSRATVEIKDNDVQTKLFQLRLLGISDCLQWTEIDSATKKEGFLSSVTSAIDEICQCGFSLETFHNVDITGAFQCFEKSPTTVTFRGEIGPALRANASQVISYMEQWVTTNPTIVIQNTRLIVDSSCNVKINSFNDPECGNMTSTVNDGSNTAVIVGGILGGLLATLIIALSLVVIVILLRTQWKKVSYNVDRDGAYDYPMAPLQLVNPMTDAPIVTEGNQAYGRHTRHAEIAAEDDEYVHMNSVEAPIQLQPSIASTTENPSTEERSLLPTTLQGGGLESEGNDTYEN